MGAVSQGEARFAHGGQRGSARLICPNRGDNGSRQRSLLPGPCTQKASLGLHHTLLSIVLLFECLWYCCNIVVFVSGLVLQQMVWLLFFIDFYGFIWF